tara:strand:- start:318 stop:851 length:534 start_codon:yes stop_codon:yes gene_type:complete
MHKLFFYFIDEFKKKHLTNLDKNISIIYRNYNKIYNESEVLEIKKFCLSTKRNLFISNNLHLANKLKLDGIYIPSFNKDFSIIRKIDKRLKIIGSAHNVREIMIKKKQKVDLIFISPIFKVKKKTDFLDIYRFNILSKMTRNRVIALGGINKQNIKKIKIVNCSGFAGISYFNDRIK